MKKVVTPNKRPVKMYIVAQCQDCNWYCEYSNVNIIKEARKHVYKTGHTVVVDTEYSQYYRLEKQ